MTPVDRLKSNPAGPDPADPDKAHHPQIRVRGARVHNLDNVHVDIPRDRLVVVTGPSGSGKSSLAFDTLHAEGQRQYIETLSVYARQFLHQIERPDVDLVDGLPPTVSIDQRVGSHSPRSTVATLTEIYDYLRLLMARVGELSCCHCGQAIAQQTAEEIQEELLRLPEGTRTMILAPMVRGRKGQHAQVLESIRKAGLIRARIDGGLYELDLAPSLETRRKHHIEAVVDRVVIRPGIATRLAESVRLALKLGDGMVLASYLDRSDGDKPRAGRPSRRAAAPDGVWRDAHFSTQYACPNCRAGFVELEPRIFSFNSPYGACPTCQGLGTQAEPDATEGTNGEPPRPPEPCPACDGTRLRAEARSCRLGGKPIHQITAMTVAQAHAFFSELAVDEKHRPVAVPLIQQITGRLAYLEKVGVTYLTLDRAANTLSGGEMQRVRLATAIGSGLTAVCYLLDEPTIGLHPRDTDKLIDAFRQLQQQGNTVIVVEHDAATIRAADYLFDLGPGAGPEGGRIVAQGPPDRLQPTESSLTADYLCGKRQIPLPAQRRRVVKARSIELKGAATNNLKGIDVRFPLSALVCVTGVSGSGKSSLVNLTLAGALAHRLGQTGPAAGQYDGLRVHGKVDRVIRVDQSPIGRTPRSNPATYCGVFDEVRKVFAGTRQARQRGYRVGRFSFNMKGGRCELCQGQGVQKIEMKFLPDLFATCPDCDGARFNRQTLQVRFRNRSIADVLNMPVAEAATLFQNIPAIHPTLELLDQVGLGYLALGQPSTTLSGGEAQRVKLATELARPATGSTFYLLDEPTTGLHFDDIRRLLAVLQQLVDRGNTVLVIEHNLDVIKSADWVIDLGPEGGERGGEVVASGTPEEIAAVEENHTGRFLRPLLDNHTP